jgi:DNA-binding NarL/FixJ family response regulator
MSPPVTVVVADDVEAIRLMLAFVLDMHPSIDVVGEARNGREAVDQAERHQPTVVVLDLSMPIMDGLEALPEIRRVAPGAKIVVLSGFETDAMAAQALALGAESYVEKGADPDVIVRAIEAAAGLTV